MIQYTKSEFCGGPKDGDKRVADRTKLHHFTSSDPDSAHSYGWVPNQAVFNYIGLVDRRLLPESNNRVEPLSVGVER